jgi:hypothetical protein
LTSWLAAVSSLMPKLARWLRDHALVSLSPT